MMARNKIARNISLAVIALLLGTARSSQCVSAEFSFEVVGEVRCTTFEEAGTNTYFSRYHVAVSGCNTWIRSKLLLDDDPDYAADYHEYTCQGSNSTLLVRYRDDLMVTNATRENLGVTETIKLEKPQPPWNQGTVLVRPDPLPPYGFEALTAVWLAYGSRCHYEKSGQGQVSPVVSVGDEFRESGGKVSSHWTVESRPPGFLAFMAEFSEGINYKRLGRQVEVRPWPKPFDTGFTNAIFRTIEWTNMAGYSLPRKVELVAFVPDLAKLPQKKLKVAYMMVGETHSVVLGTTRTNVTSSLPERYAIDYSHRDERSRAESFTYRTADGKVISYEQFLGQQKARAGER